jgi:hypothetical protein
VPIAPVALERAQRQGNLVGRGFDLLQTDNVRTLTLDPFIDLAVPRPDAVDVPSGKLQWNLTAVEPRWGPIGDAAFELEPSVSCLPLRRGNSHDIGVRRDMGPGNFLGLCHRIRIAIAVDRIRFDEILLVRRRRIDAFVDCPTGHAGTQAPQSMHSSGWI